MNGENGNSVLAYNLIYTLHYVRMKIRWYAVQC